MMKKIFFIAATLSILAISFIDSTGQDRPNIIWLVADDMSPHIGNWGSSHVNTPNLDKLSKEGFNFRNAFASSPACSPARSTLITGVASTTLGTHNLRSSFPIPDFIKGFPSLLREAGYYTTNNVKTDYNTRDEKRIVEHSWDESSRKAHWRNRSNPNQPFFSVFNFVHTHQSRAGFLDQKFPEIEKYVGTHNPEVVSVPPFYPNTPIVQKTMARYYDAITAMDARVGELLHQLKEDGLSDSTIVIFFSDHGMGLPRGKRTLYDSGLQVPLIVYMPPAFREFYPAQKTGDDLYKLVTFADFAPTMLKLVGLPVPDYMQGRPFLVTSKHNQSSYVFGARDRIDEAIDMSRSVRDERYLYIRNYYPHISWNAPEFFSDKAPIRSNITKLADADKLNKAQLTYAGSEKPIEELYDTWKDPYQVDNLADSKDHQGILSQMRTRLHSWILAKRDLGFMPEEELYAKSADTNAVKPWEYARNGNEYPLERIVSTADLVGRENAIHKQITFLQDDNPVVRYWAAVGLRSTDEDLDQDALSVIQSALSDPASYVRTEIAAFLFSNGLKAEESIEALSEALNSNNPVVVLRAARSLQLIGNKGKSLRTVMEKVRNKYSDKKTAYRRYIYESLNELLSSFSESQG